MTQGLPRRWTRWLTQFSLRTLLILVTLSAVACWWFLQPESREEALFGRLLTLQRQVRLVPQNPAAAGQSPSGEQSAVTRFVNAGRWRLFDEFGGAIARGRYHNDQPHGQWQLFHANGQLAAEGKMVRGQRDGLWRTWDASSNPESEVTYKAVFETTTVMRSAPKVPPYPTTIPVVGMTNVLGQFDAGASLSSPGGGMIGGFCGTSGVWYAPPRAYPQPLGPHSVRHGPCRVWHTTAQTPTRRVSEGGAATPTRRASEGGADEPPALRFEGHYANDLRTGLWTYYDEQGRVVERGTFAFDRREGVWETIDAVSGKTAQVEYIAGRPQAEHERRIAEIESDLASNSLRRQVAAISRLAEIGNAGQPLLVKLLSHSDDNLKLLALRTLVRQGHIPPEALAFVQPLADHADSRFAVRAKTALYLAQPEKRDELLSELLDASPPVRLDLLRETVFAAYLADAERREPLVREAVRRVAPLHAPEPWYGENRQDIDCLAELGPGVIPYLAAAFEQGSASERLYIMAVLEEVVSRDMHVEWNSGISMETYEPSPATRQLIERGKADADPRIQSWARQVGQPRGSLGGMSGFGPGFF